MFAQTRRRLVLWNVLALSLVLVAVGVTVYLVLSRSVINQVDRNLANRSEEVASNLREFAEGDIGLNQPGFQGGLFYLLATQNGRITANPQGIPLDELPIANTGLASPHFATVEVDEEPARVYLRPLTFSRSPNLLWLGVGQSLTQELRDIRRLRLVLLIGAGVGLTLTLAAAWFLSGRAIDPIRRAYERQQGFAADASHELRTPLAVMKASTDLLAQHLDEPLRANTDLLEDARHEIKRMEGLTEELLILTRSDTGQLRLALGDVNVPALAQEVTENLQVVARELGVELVYEGTAEPVTTSADPDRLEQVIMILLDNALKYTEKGGSATLSVRRDGDTVLLSVTDTGAGIASDQLPHVFERFYRADPARATGQHSTGLGLAIAKSLVEAHGGRIAISSTVGKGTVVSVRLAAQSHGA